MRSSNVGPLKLWIQPRFIQVELLMLRIAWRQISVVAAFIFKPLGFGTWQAVASLISGSAAKEGIVSTDGSSVWSRAIETITLRWEQRSMHFPNRNSSHSFLMFNPLDSPCPAAISTKLLCEMNNRNHFWYTIAFRTFLHSFALVIS